MNGGDEREKMGPACKNCGHVSGMHESLAGQDLDEGEAGDACRFDGCSCPGFMD